MKITVTFPGCNAVRIGLPTLFVVIEVRDMLEIEEVTGKHSRLYRCPDDIANFKLRVRVKDAESERDESVAFGWQEKRFSRSEKEFYGDPKNCASEQDETYHERVKDLPHGDGVVFSYVQEDGVIPEEDKLLTSNPSDIFQKLQDGKVPEDASNKRRNFDFVETLNDAMKNPYVKNVTENMYIMADFGEYYDNTWLKSEYMLCSLKYNPEGKTMRLFPDYTQEDPYVIRINSDSSRKVEYWLENASLDGVESVDLLREDEVINQMALYDKVRTNRLAIGDFKQPEPNRLKVHLFFDILSARNFENDNVYVEYYVELPKNWLCKEGELRGATPSCSGAATYKKAAYFGYPVELNLEYEMAPVASESPCIYFEVISKDSWSRYRSEGLSYQKLPIFSPGVQISKLQCLRITSNPLGNLRRFFLGDCGNYHDVGWFGLPKIHEGPAVNKQGADTIGTGELQVKYSVVHHSRASGVDGRETKEKYLMRQLQDPALIKSVEQVVEAFKRARVSMLEARRRL